jgi:hypothetical protein
MPDNVAAPELQPPAAAPQTGKSFWPTRKWWAATVTAIFGLATMYLSTKEFSLEFQIALLGAIGQAIVTYILPNADTPGGVPLKRPAS